MVADLTLEARPALSVVATLYRSEPYLKEFHRRVTETVVKLGIASYEIVLVNDGSPDNSKALALSLQAVDPSVVLVDLSRNFGHHRAMLAGLAHAAGELIFLIDCDLEEDPELLSLLMQEMEQSHCDVVCGMQKSRRGGWFERVTGNLYYRIINSVSGIEFLPNLLTLRLMTRRYVESLLLFKEREVLLNGIAHLAGYEQATIPVVKHRRNRTTYPLSKRFALLFLSVISFSDRPLKWIFGAGLGITLFALLYISWILIQFLFFGIGVSGFTSIIVSLWLIGGMNFLFLGTIGLYVGTIFSEAKHRPTAIVRDIYRVAPGRSGSE